MSATDGQSGPAETSWGTHPTEQRKDELEETLRKWEAESNPGDRRGPLGETLREREAESNLNDDYNDDYVQLWQEALRDWKEGSNLNDRRGSLLEETLRKWEAESNPGDRRGPFDGTPLNGADVFWLAICSLSHHSKVEAERLLRMSLIPPIDLSRIHLEGAHLEKAWLTGAHLERAHLEKAWLTGAHLEGARLVWANLVGAHLERAHLVEAHLVGAHLEGAHLERAYLERADLEGAHLEGARLEKVILRRAYLKGANLRRAGLREAILVDADLRGANVTRADLQQANLYRTDLREGEFAEADLRGSSLVAADLRGANLSRAIFDIEANLADAKLGDRECGFASVIDTAWNGVILASVDWSGLFRNHWWLPLSRGKLGDDQRDPRTAARAHRQLAMALRAQGLNAEAAELDYRAHIRASKDLWNKKRYPAALFSWLACAVFGYGYRLGRCLALYVGVVLLFSLIYCLIPYGHKASSSFYLPWWPKAVISFYLPWWPKAVILSFTSFHGRGFLPSDVTGSVWHGAWAAGEAVVGLFIEVTLIATFTQRVFR